MLVIFIRVEEKFGIFCDLGMFFYGICFICVFSDEVIEFKFEVYKNFGWIELDILILVRKNFYFLIKLEFKIRIILNVWMNEFGYYFVEIV